VSLEWDSARIVTVQKDAIRGYTVFSALVAPASAQTIH
jgi:hypothetical protein